MFEIPGCRSAQGRSFPFTIHNERLTAFSAIPFLGDSGATGDHTGVIYPRLTIGNPPFPVPGSEEANGSRLLRATRQFIALLPLPLMTDETKLCTHSYKAARRAALPRAVGPEGGHCSSFRLPAANWQSA
jgi:hypothetical protein